MRSYTGDIGALAATHPPFLLSYKLSWILQSSETTCRWLLILIASTHWLSWCVRRKIPHLSDTMSLGSWWVSEQPWAHRARKEAAEQLQGFRCFCGKERETGNMGHLGEIFLLVLPWGFKQFYNGVSQPGIAPKAKTPHAGDLFQKTTAISVKCLAESKGHFSQGFFNGLLIGLVVPRPMLSSHSCFCHCFWLALKSSGSWPRWSLKVPSKWTLFCSVLFHSLAATCTFCTCPCIFPPSRKAQCGKDEASVSWPT